MKKIVLIIALIIATLQSNAQQEYDTIVYHSPELIGCEMTFDTTVTIWGTSGFSGYYMVKVLNCYVATYDSLGNMIPPYNPSGLVLSYNNYKPEGFAQPYHLDSNAMVCGIAVRTHGDLPYYASYGTYKFHLMDEDYNELNSVPITSADTVMYSPQIWQCPMKQYYFEKPTLIKDFYLTADMCIDRPIYGSAIMYNHTRSLFDTTPCLDTILGCQASYSPLLKKNGQWIRFADDTVYEMFQKTFIEFLPIILIPRADTSSLLEKINIDNTCSVYPNPAKDKLTVLSQYKINDIEIYNTSGVKVKSLYVNSNERAIDISDLKAGSYVVRINTTRGTATKKFVIR